MVVGRASNAGWECCAEWDRTRAFDVVVVAAGAGTGGADTGGAGTGAGGAGTLVAAALVVRSSSLYPLV